jgi:hypothetical protein
MLFGTILTVVFEDIVFNPSKVKVTYRPCDVFMQQERHDPQLSGEKQNEASLSGSNFKNLYVKKTLLGEKIVHGLGLKY